MIRKTDFALLPEGFCVHFAPCGAWASCDGEAKDGKTATGAEEKEDGRTTEREAGLWKARLADLFARMRAGGRLRDFFYDMDREPTLDEWLAYAGRPQYRFLIVRDAERDAPLGFLNIEAGRFAHFCTLPAAPYARLVAAGRQALAWAGRRFGLGELLGITPACYRHVFAYLGAVGFTPLARIPKAVYCHGRWRDAVLSRWLREGGERSEAA
ncbi:MAG: hypothetical protein K6F46_07390 [Desulfovibrio sp.]|nr:hypothetical protein [Desulfovibrio sp.]